MVTVHCLTPTIQLFLYLVKQLLGNKYLKNRNKKYEFYSKKNYKLIRLKNKKTPSLIRYGPEKNLLEKLAVNLDFMKRLALTNIWLFAPLLQLYSFYLIYNF